MPSHQCLRVAEHPKDDARLSPLLAFVVELREGTSFHAEAVCGRIEHVSSGRACLFESLEQARAFMQDASCSNVPLDS